MSIFVGLAAGEVDSIIESFSCLRGSHCSMKHSTQLRASALTGLDDWLTRSGQSVQYGFTPVWWRPTVRTRAVHVLMLPETYEYVLSPETERSCRGSQLCVL